MASNRKRSMGSTDSNEVVGATASTLTKTKEYTNLFGYDLDLVIINSSIVDIPIPIDALVNCTGPKFEHHVGVSKAIYEHVGDELDDEFDSYLDTHGELEFTVVHDTPAFNLTNHKNILHIRSPTARNKYMVVNGNQVSLIETTYYNLLKKTFIDLSLESLVMPLIGTGAARVSIESSSGDLVTALHKFLVDFSPRIADQKRTVYIVNNSSNMLIEAEFHLSKKISSLCQAHGICTDKTSKVNKTEGDNAEDDDDEDEDEDEDEDKDEDDDGEEEKEDKSDESVSSSTSSQTEKDNECVICLDTIKDEKKLDQCIHSFCRSCIDEYFETVKKNCPVCNTSYGMTQGNQPNGTMTHRVTSSKLPGFESSTGMIEITYSIPSGIQDRRHPNPGLPYHGCTRIAYLPDTTEGRHVLDLLKKAFDQKLIFTVGQSRTTGLDNMVTWNDIHHKTSIYGGPTCFGYPDATYLNRVQQELADKGIS